MRRPRRNANGASRQWRPKRRSSFWTEVGLGDEGAASIGERAEIEQALGALQDEIGRANRRVAALRKELEETEIPALTDQRERARTRARRGRATPSEQGVGYRGYSARAGLLYPPYRGGCGGAGAA